MATAKAMVMVMVLVLVIVMALVLAMAVTIIMCACVGVGGVFRSYKTMSRAVVNAYGHYALPPQSFGQKALMYSYGLMKITRFCTNLVILGSLDVRGPLQLAGTRS